MTALHNGFTLLAAAALVAVLAGLHRWYERLRNPMLLGSRDLAPEFYGGIVRQARRPGRARRMQQPPDSERPDRSLLHSCTPGGRELGDSADSSSESSPPDDRSSQLGAGVLEMQAVPPP